MILEKLYHPIVLSHKMHSHQTKDQMEITFPPTPLQKNCNCLLSTNVQLRIINNLGTYLTDCDWCAKIDETNM